MSEADAPPLTIAIALDDPALATRVTGLLAGLRGIRLAAPGEPATLRLVAIAPAPAAARAAPATDIAHAAPVTDVARAAPATDVARAAPVTDAPLTARERQVLGLLAEGASNKLIARQLGISVHTAKFHVGQVLDKLDATGRTDAVAHAARLGVIHL